MKKGIFERKTLVLLLVVLCVLTAAALAYTVPDDTVVYVTPTGEKYHREDCSYTSSVRPMTIQAAERKGYDACSRCDPDRLTGEYHSSWDGKSGKSSGSSSSSSSKPADPPKIEASAETDTKQKKNPFIIELIKIIGIICLDCVVFVVGLGAFMYVVELIKKLFKRK